MSFNKSILLFFFLCSQTALHAFDLPRGAFTIDQIKEARVKAESEKLPILWVYTDANST